MLSPICSSMLARIFSLLRRWGKFGLDRIRHWGELVGLKRIEILVVLRGYPLFDRNNPMPAWMVQDALHRIKAGLEPRIRAKAAKGVEVVFKVTRIRN